MANRKKPPPLKVELPTPQKDRPPWTRVGVIVGAGLLIGVLWPRLANVHIGPQVPGAKKPAATATQPVAPPPSPTAKAAVALASSAAASKASNKQLVVVGEGTIDRCWHKREQLKAGQCGALRVDRALVHRLEDLATCPSALGLSGELQVGFDFDFKKGEVRVLKGKKKSAIPSSTVRGILTCIADYLGDVSPEKIRHKYTKYRIYYTLRFFPPGAHPADQPVDEPEPEERDAGAPRGTAMVTWDTALIRDEPRTGKVVARLVRGTRVTLLSKRKDWYQVRIRSKKGWVYRGAVGL